MTTPLPPPRPKDPLRRSRVALRPARARSRAAVALAVVAARGGFALHTCCDCGAIQYPPRDVCRRCLGERLSVRPAAPRGVVIATTTVRASAETYFRERAPWKVATVRLDCGVPVIAFLHGDCPTSGPVRVALRLDRAGQAVMVALPPEETANMHDDPMLRELGCDPKHRRVLVTDGLNPLGLAVAEALADAGAQAVFLGVADPWKAPAPPPALGSRANIQRVPLDLTDTRSVQELGATLGGRVDILVNTAHHIRPGGILERSDLSWAREEIEGGYLGFLRLAQAFGPVMRARAADGVASATAWVNLFSVYARATWSRYGYYSAAQAAVYAAAQGLRGDFAATGVRVCDIFFGPLDVEWHQELPPPKVAPAAVARAVVEALRGGLEERGVGDVAAEVLERLARDPKVLQRELIP